ncbi:phosphodiester glycosidase family protein [Desulfovibrio sp. OttesenSCG-928-C06]|nr:phosphodiester glycosidase family protein [Desulfovibrio sp. OttesenSCG-928-C06]
MKYKNTNSYALPLFQPGTWSLPPRIRSMTLLFGVLWLILCTCSPAFAEEQADAKSNIRPATLKLNPDAVHWVEHQPGLDVLTLNIKKYFADDTPVLEVSAAKEQGNSDMVIVRSDPERFEYSLHMTSEDGQRLSLLERVRRHDLLAAINAGMYLPDNLKNTGYMRNGQHTNNPRIVSNFGSFFVAGPRKPGLPQANLMEKPELGQSPQDTLDNYNLALQNYRLISQKGGILWPESESTYSISALSKDSKGNILFITCVFPLSAPDFSRLLLELPINSGLAMYLEGGSQAGLSFCTEKDGQKTFMNWRGRHGGLAGLGRLDNVPLPNVLGLKPKS